MKGCAYYVHTCGSGPGLDSLQFNLFLNIGFFWTRKIHISLSLRSWTCLVIRVFRDASAEIISKSVWQLLFAKFQEIGREGCSYLIKTWIEPMIQVQDIFAIIRLDSSDGKALSWAGLYLPTISVVFILASLSCFDSGPVQPASCGYFQAVHKLKHEYSLPESDPCRGTKCRKETVARTLIDLWDEVWADSLAVGVPGGSVLALVLLVLLVDADDVHDGVHDGQVVDQQVNAPGHGHWKTNCPS